MGARPLSRGPPEAPPTSTPTPYIHVRGEKNRENDSSRFMIRSRRQALISLGRADLESVWGSGEGDSSSSSSTILHHQFHDAHRVSNSIVGLLDGDVLDEIYHVIELVLLGLIPSIHYVLRLMLL